MGEIVVLRELPLKVLEVSGLVDGLDDTDATAGDVTEADMEALEVETDGEKESKAFG